MVPLRPHPSLALRPFVAILLATALALLPAPLLAGLGGRVVGKGVGKLVGKGASRAIVRGTVQQGERRMVGGVAGKLLGKGATQGTERAAGKILARTSRTGARSLTATGGALTTGGSSGKVVKATSGLVGGTHVPTGSVAAVTSGDTGAGLLGQGVGGQFPRAHWEKVLAGKGITPASDPVLFERLMRGRQAAWTKQQASLVSGTGGRAATTGLTRTARPGTGPVPAPKQLKAFPQATRAKPKTPVQGGGGLRKRWVDRKGRIYEWDSQHGTVEMYSSSGRNHLGEFDAATGRQLKPPDPTRHVEP